MAPMEWKASEPDNVEPVWPQALHYVLMGVSTGLNDSALFVCVYASDQHRPTLSLDTVITSLSGCKIKSPQPFIRTNLRGNKVEQKSCILST